MGKAKPVAHCAPNAHIDITELASHPEEPQGGVAPKPPKSILTKTVRHNKLEYGMDGMDPHDHEDEVNIKIRKQPSRNISRTSSELSRRSLLDSTFPLRVLFIDILISLGDTASDFWQVSNFHFMARTLI